MIAAFLVEELALEVGALEHDPTLLDRFFAPILWLGVVVIVLNVVASASRSDGWLSQRFCPTARRIALVYSGLSLAVSAVLCVRVFCTTVYADALTPKDFAACRMRQLMWLFEIALIWGLGFATVGGVSLLKVLWPMRKGPTTRRHSQSN